MVWGEWRDANTKGQVLKNGPAHHRHGEEMGDMSEGFQQRWLAVGIEGQCPHFVLIPCCCSWFLSGLKAPAGVYSESKKTCWAPAAGAAFKPAGGGGTYSKKVLIHLKTTPLFSFVMDSFTIVPTAPCFQYVTWTAL